MKIYVIGVGMGNLDTLTVGAERAIAASDVVVGAPRLIEPFREGAARGLVKDGAQVRAAIRAGEIVDVLDELRPQAASALFSGDIGFFSGAALIYGKLADRFPGCEVKTIPGISSLTYFCARLHRPWAGVHVVSAHGRSCDAAGEVQTHEQAFFITGGTERVQHLCAQLDAAGLGACPVWVGERLSYADERVVHGTASELARQEFEGLSVLLVENPAPIRRAAQAPGIADGDFFRNDTPMTKEEVRDLVICKLRIERGHTVWDVGAGTGSVSVEAALAASAGAVYAVEKDAEAQDAIERNKQRFGVSNLRVVAGAAPDALAGLPAPDRVFIGGSAHAMREVVAAALSANPAVRIVATAVTLETLAVLLECAKAHGLAHELVQLSVARANAVGSHHLMRAENPVYAVTLWGGREPEDAASEDAATEGAA